MKLAFPTYWTKLNLAMTRHGQGPLTYAPARRFYDQGYSPREAALVVKEQAQAVATIRRGANGHLYAVSADLIVVREMLRLTGFALDPARGWYRARDGVVTMISRDDAAGEWAASLGRSEERKQINVE